MKIGIIGTKQVGKTTLANLLTGQMKSRGYHCDLVPEVARKSPYPLNAETSIAAVYWLIGAQIAAEALVEHTRKLIICDRTIVDSLPFFAASNPFSKDWLTYPLDLVRVYLSARPYDYFFYLPIRPERFGDSTIKDDLRTKVDIEFRMILGALGVDYLELQEIDDQARIGEVLSFIEK